MTFKKNDNVAMIQSYDGKGTFSIRRATVTAWGKKVIRLMEANGAMFKVAFSPALVNGNDQRVVADATVETLEAAAIEIAKAYLVERVAHYERCLNAGNGENYNNAIRRDMSELHEPRIIWK